MMSGVFTSLAGVGFASFLIFYRDRAKHQVVFVNSGFIAASFMYSQLHYSFGKYSLLRRGWLTQLESHHSSRTIF